MIEGKQHLEDEINQMHKNYDELSYKCDSYLGIIEQHKKRDNLSLNSEKQISILEKEVEKLQLQNRAFVSFLFTFFGIKTLFLGK